MGTRKTKKNRYKKRSFCSTPICVLFQEVRVLLWQLYNYKLPTVCGTSHCKRPNQRNFTLQPSQPEKLHAASFPAREIHTATFPNREILHCNFTSQKNFTLQPSQSEKLHTATFPTSEISHCNLPNQRNLTLQPSQPEKLYTASQRNFTLQPS